MERRRLVGIVADAFATGVASATACLSVDEQHQLSMLATRIIYTYWASTDGQASQAGFEEPDDLTATLSPLGPLSHKATP
jgi:hypothetical protein